MPVNATVCIFAQIKPGMDMNNYADTSEKSSCLECGKKIQYGRPDKKFCCLSCKNTYNNRMKKHLECNRSRITRCLENNYRILYSLYRTNVRSISIAEIISMGFSLAVMTSYSKVGRYEEYACYDISYQISSTKVFNIRRLSLNLQEEEYPLK